MRVISKRVYKLLRRQEAQLKSSAIYIVLACLVLLAVPFGNIYYGNQDNINAAKAASNDGPTATSSTYAQFSGEDDGIVCHGCGDKNDNGSGSGGSSASAKTPAVGSPAAGLSSKRYPSQVLGLANWKITLPVAKPGSGVAMEITQPALGSYENNLYFYASGNTVVLRANAGGATTSGSGYPRSELREMYGGGAHEASWSTTIGTSTMVVNQAVTHLPVVKPEVITAQVHDSNDDVIVVKLTGPHHLYAEHNSTKLGDLDTNYNLGSFFTVSIIAAGGHIIILYNGIQKVDYPIASSGDYFKAGCYTQSNVSKGDAADAYAEVQIRSLSFTHV